MNTKVQRKICKITDAQPRSKCVEIQVLKSTIQMFKFTNTNVQEHKYKCSNTQRQMFKLTHTNVQINKYTKTNSTTRCDQVDLCCAY